MSKNGRPSMANERTPGPWAAVPGTIDAREEDYFSGWEIEGPPQAQRRQFARGSDARLAAAAPDLLAACEAVSSAFYAPGVDAVVKLADAMDMIDAAIARAKGEAENNVL